ncbi:MAG TPA: discoidin domain-containing protein, partial [Gemmataceae bacterium]|nr:discoidin domain-containing protein [Gemmataceae bacterium]
PPPVLVNIALARNGGRVKSFTSQYDSSWKASHLIDGSPGLGWSSKGDKVRSSVMIELGRLASVRHVVINPYSREHVNNAVREAEVLLSETRNEGDFRSVGRLELEPIGRDQALELKAPVKARFVKIEFLKNGGGSYMQAHEVKVFAEANEEDLEARFAALFDARPGPRKKAADALKKSGDPRAVPALVRRVADDRPNASGVGDKTAALTALRALAPERVGGALIEAWRFNPTSGVRIWVAQHLTDGKVALNTEDRQEAVRLLAERIADDKLDRVADKLAALKALRVLDPERAKQALERARQSSNPEVVKWASRQ